MSMAHPAARILIIDDDEGICRTISRYLEREQFLASAASNFDDAMSALRDFQPDLVLLDLNIPGTHGFEIAKIISKTPSIGIIIISGSTEAVDRIVGLELGADDYVPKPIDFRELLARIRSVLRRLSPQSAGGLPSGNSGIAVNARFGKWTLNMLAQELRGDDGRITKLTSHEFFILSALVRAGNRVLSRDQLMNVPANRKWSPYDRSIDVLIGKVRKKLRYSETDHDYIVTMRGQGYRFALDVRWE